MHWKVRKYCFINVDWDVIDGIIHSFNSNWLQHAGEKVSVEGMFLKGWRELSKEKGMQLARQFLDTQCQFPLTKISHRTVYLELKPKYFPPNIMDFLSQKDVVTYAVSSPCKAWSNTACTADLNSSVMNSFTKFFPILCFDKKRKGMVWDAIHHICGKKEFGINAYTSPVEYPTSCMAHWFHTLTAPWVSTPKIGAFAVSINFEYSRSWARRASQVERKKSTIVRV